MSVIKGYKQTDFGMIPEDWEIAEVAELNPFVTSGSRGWAAFYSDRGSPFMRITNLSRESIYLDLTDLKLVDVPSGVSEESRTRLQTHDVLISVTADIGIVGYVGANVPIPAYINQHIALIRFDQSKAVGRFISYFLASEKPQRAFRALTDTGAKAGMSLATIKKLKLALPPLNEQHAIADALTDIDELLHSLHKLIAKKRDIKHTAMHLLLTGKKRLPGFAGKWNSRPLSEVCWFQEGPGVRNSQFTSTGVKLLNGTNIYRGEICLDSTDRFVSESEAYGPYSHFLAESGNIVIACSGISIDKFHEKVAFVRESHLPLCMNTSTMRFKPFHNDLLTAFLYHLLMSDVFKRQIGTQATGSAQLNFGPSHVARVAFDLPDVAEQAAVAHVLSDMDTEIFTLETRREKTRALKTTMMQELLTGRIRLR